jgi:hypothetical protein
MYEVRGKHPGGPQSAGLRLQDSHFYQTKQNFMWGLSLVLFGLVAAFVSCSLPLNPSLPLALPLLPVLHVARESVVLCGVALGSVMALTGARALWVFYSPLPAGESLSVDARMSSPAGRKDSHSLHSPDSLVGRRTEKEFVSSLRRRHNLRREVWRSPTGSLNSSFASPDRLHLDLSGGSPQRAELVGMRSETSFQANVDEMILDYDRRQELEVARQQRGYEPAISYHYASSYRPGTLKVNKADRSKEKSKNNAQANKAALAKEAALRLLTRLRISDEVASKWANSMREWLAVSVFQRLRSDMDRAHQVLQTLVETLRALPIVYNQLNDSQKHVLEKGEYADRVQLVVEIDTGMNARDKGVQLLKRVESYLVPTYNLRSKSVRQYVWDRTRQLGEDSYLTKFIAGSSRYGSSADTRNSRYTGSSSRRQAFSGGAHRGRQSEKDYDVPNDSEIVLHCFITFLKEAVINGPIDQHWRDEAHKKLAQHHTPKSPCIAQVNAHPAEPYYMLEEYESKGGKRRGAGWRVLPGKQNLFYALSMFVYYIKQERNGLIGHIDIKDSVLNNLDSITL